MDEKQESINNMMDNWQNSDIIVKKLKFKQETLKKLSMMTAHELFGKNQKNDELLAEMLDKIINDYFSQYINNLK
jgi:hypothetical protein